MKRTVSKILGTFFAVIDSKVKSILKNVKPVGEKIMSSIRYKLVSFFAMGYTLIACTWNIFFHDDFLRITPLWIILLITIAWILIGKVLNVIVEKDKKYKVVLWTVIFLMHFIGFVFN